MYMRTPASKYNLQLICMFVTLRFAVWLVVSSCFSLICFILFYFMLHMCERLNPSCQKSIAAQWVPWGPWRGWWLAVVSTHVELVESSPRL